jgi:hypothetical protein
MQTYRLIKMVMGREIAVKTMVNNPIRMPPASGTLYVPFGPGLADPPTKMIEAMETRVTKPSMGYAPENQP